MDSSFFIIRKNSIIISKIPVQNSVSVTKKVSNNLTSLKQQQH